MRPPVAAPDMCGRGKRRLADRSRDPEKSSPSRRRRGGGLFGVKRRLDPRVESLRMARSSDLREQRIARQIEVVLAQEEALDKRREELRQREDRIGRRETELEQRRRELEFGW